MAISIRMCKSDTIFVSTSAVYVHENLCGWKMRFCFDPFWILCKIFFFYIYISKPVYMLQHVCVCVCVRARARVLMCVEAIETVLQHTAWCLQPASCHKQSAPASVKQQAWENRALYRLQPAPRSLNRPTHLPNALRSKWAMGAPCDFETVARQQVGDGRAATTGGVLRIDSVELALRGGKRAGFVGHVPTWNAALSGWSDFTRGCD